MVLATYSLYYRGMPCNLQTFDRGLRMHGPIPLVEKMTTPSLLLVSRQVSSETLEILYKKPLVLSQTPPCLPQLAKPMGITDFTSETTLQLVRKVVFEMDLIILMTFKTYTELG